MREKFELKGVWRIPENPNRRVDGILTFDPIIGGYLHLMGSFKDITAINEMLHLDIIQGITFNGKFVTLYKCIETNSTFSSPGFLITSFYVGIIFIGVNFSSIERIKFKDISVNFSYLDQWIHISGFDKPHKQAREIQLKYKLPDIINWNMHQDLTISFYLYADYKESKLNIYQLPRELHINQRYYLKITPSEEKSFDEYLRIIRILTNFLSFVINTPVYTLSIEGTTEVNKTPIQGSMFYPKIQIFFSMTDTPDNIQENPSIDSNMLFSYEEISEWLQPMLIKWLEMADKLQPVHELYFGSLYNKGMYLYHSFSSRVQAIESYHRRVFPHETESSKDVHDYRVSEILNCITKNEYKNWLTKKLEYSNEINLGKRLNNLTKRYPVMTKLFNNREELDSFVYNVVVTRNYLTHYDESLKGQAAKEELLRNIDDKLKIIVDICFLMELGFNSDDIEIIMKRNDSYRFELRR